MSSDVLLSRVVEPALVAGVRERLPDDATVGGMAAIFGLLGDASRLRLLVALRAAGELCVGDLAATIGMSESAASHALRLLRAHGVVRARRDGRLVRYALRDGHVRTLLDVAFERSAVQRVLDQGHVAHGDG